MHTHALLCTLTPRHRHCGYGGWSGAFSPVLVPTPCWQQLPVFSTFLSPAILGSAGRQWGEAGTAEGRQIKGSVAEIEAVTCGDRSPGVASELGLSQG